MEDGLIKNTGKPLNFWKDVLKNSGFTKHGEMLKFLKTEHNFTHGFANFVVLMYRETSAVSFSEGDLISAQYQGKENLKAIYDALDKKIKSFGGDVNVIPKKATVSYKVKRQFALIQPSTKTRIDLGLKFTNRPIGGRLESSGPFGTMCTHRVILNNINQVDDELMQLIQDAYLEAK